MIWITLEEFIRLIDEGRGSRYVFTMTDKDYARVAGLKIYERIVKDCRGIYLGGGLDRQNIFDFSYLSFTDLCITKPKGMGTVLKRNDDYFGDIVIPAAREEI